MSESASGRKPRSTTRSVRVTRSSVARANADYICCTDLVLGPALDTLRELNADPKNAGAFDLAFIDADKVNYPNYYEALLPLLCKRGTIICDNMMWSMKVANPAITDPDTNGIRALHDRIVKDPRVVASTLNFSDGITMIVKL